MTRFPALLLAAAVLSTCIFVPFSFMNLHMGQGILDLDDGLQTQSTSGRNGTNGTGTTFNWNFPKNCWGPNESIDVHISMGNVTLQQVVMWWQLGSNDNGSVVDSGTPILNVSSNGSLSHTLSIPSPGFSQASVEIFVRPKDSSLVDLFQNNFLRTNTIDPSCSSTNTSSNSSAPALDWTMPKTCWAPNETIVSYLVLENVSEHQQIAFEWELVDNTTGLNTILDSGAPWVNVSPNGSVFHTLEIDPVGPLQATYLELRINTADSTLSTIDFQSRSIEINASCYGINHNWTISPTYGPQSGGVQLNISGDFSWVYDGLHNTSSSHGPLNHTWSNSIIEVNFPEDYSIAIDSNNNAHAVYYSFAGIGLEYTVRNNGVWDTPELIEYSISPYSFACTIAVDSVGNPHIAYWNGSYLKYTHKNNGTWSQPVVFDQVSEYSSHQELFVDGDDNVYILQHNSSSQTLSLLFHDGVSWTNSLIDNSTYARFTNAGFASLHVDSAGDVHVAYFRENGIADFELIYSRFNGSTWSPSSIRSSLQASASVSILTDSTSTVHVAYGAEVENENETELTHAISSGGVWLESVIDGARAGKGNSLTVDSNDNLYLAYTIEAASYEVGFATFDGSSWATRNLAVDQSFNESYSHKLVMRMDSNDNLTIVYISYERAGDQLEFLWGGSSYSPGKAIKVDFSDYANVTATFVDNTTMTLSSPEGPVEGFTATVTVWIDGQGYEISTPFTFLPEASDDEDADGFPDDMDDCPANSGNSTQDRIGCPDMDADGYSDLNDAFPQDPTEWNDTDTDGTGDNSDLFPADPNEQSDSDSDGVGDNADVFPNDSNETSDSDGDGVGDNADVFPNNSNETEDADGDGLGNNEDDYPFIHNFIDSDEDGYPDLFDDFINDPTQWGDYDGDGYGDYSEGNNSDAFINNASQWFDTDGDGYGDNWGNSTWNLTRLFIWPGQFVENAVLADHCPTEFGNSTTDGYFGCPDLDGDGIADMYDDVIELNANNTANETNETSSVDLDGDGVEDLFDLCPNTAAGSYVDIDGCLLDEDGDGVDDLTDACPGTPTGVPVNINGCPLEVKEEKTFMESLRSGDQTTVLQTVGIGAVLIAVLGFLQTNMIAALLPDSLRWIRVFRTGVKLNQEEIQELEYLKSLVQTYYLDIQTLHEELYQLKSELSARYTNSEIKKVTKEKLCTLIDDLLNMDGGEVHRVAHNDAFFGLGGSLSTQQRTDYLAQEALMRIDDGPANLPQFEEVTPSTESTHPPAELKGEMNQYDGYEYLEHPSGSGKWYYRQRSNDPWDEWAQ